jgi:hypothetical protein
MEYQGQHGGHASSRADEHGNPAVTTGNAPTGMGAGHIQEPAREDKKTDGVLRRSGSSSSSSSVRRLPPKFIVFFRFDFRTVRIVATFIHFNI